MASLPIRYRPAAIEELDEAIKWYGERSARAANRLREVMRKKLADAAKTPRMWPLRRDGTRHIYLRSFPYVLIVREISGTLEVVAIAHTSRRPGYWRHRLK